MGPHWVDIYNILVTKPFFILSNALLFIFFKTQKNWHILEKIYKIVCYLYKMYSKSRYFTSVHSLYFIKQQMEDFMFWIKQSYFQATQYLQQNSPWSLTIYSK